MDITLTRKESDTIRSAAIHLEDVCQHIHNAGGSRRLVDLLAEAERAARTDAPSAAPRFACARADVMRGVLRGLEADPPLASIAMASAWYLMSCALGAAIRAESERLNLCYPLLVNKLTIGVNVYGIARDRWLRSLGVEV